MVKFSCEWTSCSNNLRCCKEFQSLEDLFLHTWCHLAQNSEKLELMKRTHKNSEEMYTLVYEERMEAYQLTKEIKTAVETNNYDMYLDACNIRNQFIGSIPRF